jgi:SecD/SecF fusion protein
MVKDLGVDDERATPQPAATGASRPAGGRRARARANGGTPPAPPPAGDGGEQPPKERKPRNKRHGRPR